MSPAAKRVSSKMMIKALERVGYRHVSTKGSHYKMRRGGVMVIVPLGRDPLPVGTQRAIMTMAMINDGDL